MTDTRVTDITDALDDYLERERAALLAGDLELLVRLANEKEALIDALSQSASVPRAVLQRLQTKIEGNQALFESALDGIRTVARRLGAMRRARSELETYTRDGRKTMVNQSHPRKLEKKA